MSQNRDNKINSFWNQAYHDIDDGGYISDDREINRYRFLLEKKELIGFIEKYTTKDNRKRALDIGCGNGKFTEVMADYFAEVDAIDLSQEIIDKNREKKRRDNCNYYCENLEDFSKRVSLVYDFIYVGGVLMYIDDENINKNYKALYKLLNNNGVLILRESVMTIKRVDNISNNYIAYYRHCNDYRNILDFDLLDKKENMAYRTSELRNVLMRLKLSFLFKEKSYQKLLPLLKVKDRLWKVRLNKLVNYYYIFRKKK